MLKKDPFPFFLFLPFVFAIGGIAYVFGVVIYRLAFHPLSKYPGPFLAKITDIHIAWHAWRGSRHLHLYRCHEKYGWPLF